MIQRKLGRLQAGFIPFLVIAIIAILAIGGGAYVVSKNKAKVKTGVEGNGELNANANAKGSLRSLLGMGKNVMCTFESTSGDNTSSGTVYITADGAMRGDFKMGTGADAQTSSMLVKDGTSYVWSGTKGVKMAASGEAQANANAQVQKSVDLDSQVQYSCSDWAVEQSKFDLPAGVEFVDLKAMMNIAPGAGAGADVKGGVKIW
jgi:hypothetical protein